MKKIRVDVRELGTAGAAGAAGMSGALNVREDAHLSASAGAWTSSVAAGVPQGRRSWLRFGLRIVRNAAVAVALMTLVPIGAVMLSGGQLAGVANIPNIAVRRAMTDAMRSFRLAPDASITPMQAGLAFNALQSTHVTSPGFENIELASHPLASWQTETVAPEMFATARPDIYQGPSSRTILEASVKGFSPREMAYLRALATSPVWHEYDLIARAPAVDFVGGQLKIPFGSEAVAWQRPIPHYKEARELAYAAVSRAAYYMANGQRDSAETVLRSIVSFGLAFVDNGTTLIDELIGDMIVGVGRDALQRYFVITHDARATLPALRVPRKEFPSGAAFRAANALSGEQSRSRLLAKATDPLLAPGERFESLRFLSASSCMTVRELMFGQGADVAAAIAKARLTLARFPSERALVDLETRWAMTVDPLQHAPALNPIQSFAVSSATVAGVVLNNPRLAACTRLLTRAGYGQ
ncbi:MAG: hypothetical protein ABJE47_07670 [bacterium]